MKYWVKIIDKNQSSRGSRLETSHLWDSLKPLLVQGSSRLLIDLKDNKFYFHNLHSNGNFEVEVFDKNTTENSQCFDVQGKDISLTLIPEGKEISFEDLAAYKNHKIEIPTVDSFNFDEMAYKSISKRTFLSGGTALVALFAFTLIQSYFVSNEEVTEEISLTKAVPVKLNNAPTPAVVAAAYERAMQQGSIQAKKLDKSEQNKSAPPKSSVENLKSAFASLLGGGLEPAPHRGVAAKSGAEVAALLPGVQGSGTLGKAGQRSGGKAGDSLVKVAYSGAGEGGYQVGGDTAGVGLNGVDGQGNGWLSLNLTDALVEEGLSRDEVGRVIHGRISEIRYCYEASMLHKPDIEGKLIIDFTIAGSGRVRTANVKESSVRDERLNECILKRLARWEFPKPKSGVEVAVSYPFIFKRLRR